MKKHSILTTNLSVAILSLLSLIGSASSAGEKFANGYKCTNSMGVSMDMTRVKKASAKDWTISIKVNNQKVSGLPDFTVSYKGQENLFGVITENFLASDGTKVTLSFPTPGLDASIAAILESRTAGVAAFQCAAK